MLVLPLILVILHPRRTPALPAADSRSIWLTLRSPSARKKTLIPRSAPPSVVCCTRPVLELSHSVFFIAKLQRSTGVLKPGSILYLLTAVIVSSGVAKVCGSKVVGIWLYHK